jgi:peptidoglycan/LPS O-acetylase OafA/YrhL
MFSLVIFCHFYGMMKGREMNREGKRMEKKRIKKSRYITGFDGIRSLAVIGVIFYHLIPTSMQGGYLGVPVFFVISGYLITDLLRQEWQQNGKIQIKDFYIRRIKRLYPAMLVLLILSSAYITLFQRNLLNNLRGIVTSSLLYVNNWWQINHGMSYFDRFGGESPFTHLWSLALEGQHYLIFPVIFVLLVKFVKRKNKIFAILSIGGLLSAILMGILYTPDVDPTRVYYGTDTRIFSVWVGSALAFIWPSMQLKSKIPSQAKRVLNASGILALVLLMLSFIYLGAQQPFVYYGGMYLISLVAAVLVAVTAHLYQFPVMIFYEAKVKNIANNSWMHVLIELFLILFMSELSYQLVEKPMRYFNFRKLRIKVKEWLALPLKNSRKITGIVCALVTVTALVGITTAPSNQVDAAQEKFQKDIAKNKEAAEKTKDQQNKVELGENAEEIMATYDLTKAQLEEAYNTEVTAFGDSVMLGATIDLQQVFPQAIVDADVGRQLYQAAELLKSLREQGLLKDKVVLALGTNGTATEAQFDGIMATIGERQVYLVNVHVPTQRWQNEVNDLFNRMAEKYDNITLIDWYGESVNHEEWFREDSVHPDENGLTAYVSLIAKAILN